MNTAPDLLFEDLKTFVRIKDLVTQKSEETLYLEFKEKHDRRDAKLHEDDKKNFSEVLSQFANSDGGVLVWGIQVGRKDGNEWAESLKAIDDVVNFCAGLKNYLQAAVQPMVDGVDFFAVLDEGSANAGFVIVKIPASTKTPHRAMVTREYLKRNSNGKQRLEHFDLEDMFGRRQKPNLCFLVESKSVKPHYNALSADNNGWLPPVDLDCFILNEGRAIAKSTRLILSICGDSKFEKNSIKAKTTLLTDPTQTVGRTMQYDDFGIFYPEFTSSIGALSLRMKLASHQSDDAEVIRWVLICEDMLKKEGVITVGDMWKMVP